MEENKGQEASLEKLEKLKTEISRLEEEVSHKQEIEELEQKKLELEAILNDQKEKAKNGDFDTSTINTRTKKTNFKKSENINFSIRSGDVSEKDYYGSEIELAEEVFDGSNNNYNENYNSENIQDPRFKRNSQLLLSHNVEETIEKSYKSNRNKLIAFGILALFMSLSGVIFYSQMEKKKNKDILNQELNQALKEMDKKIETKAKEEVEKRLLEERKKTEELEKKIAEQTEALNKTTENSKEETNSTNSNNEINKKEEQNNTKKEKTPSSSINNKVVNNNVTTTKKNNVSSSINTNTKSKQTTNQNNVVAKSTTKENMSVKQNNNNQNTVISNNKENQKSSIPSNKGLANAISKSGGEMNKVLDKVNTVFDDWMNKNNREAN